MMGKGRQFAMLIPTHTLYIMLLPWLTSRYLFTCRFHVVFGQCSSYMYYLIIDAPYRHAGMMGKGSSIN